MHVLFISLRHCFGILCLNCSSLSFSNNYRFILSSSSNLGQKTTEIIQETLNLEKHTDVKNRLLDSVGEGEGGMV